MSALAAELTEILFRSDISHAERMRQVRGLSTVSEVVRERLEWAFDEHDWDTFEAYLWAAFEHPVRSMTRVLCAALELRDHRVPNADVVQVLAEVADPAALPCLRATLWWLPEWDEFHQLAVKCVWAITAIGGVEAREVLRDAASRGPEVVREWASSALAKGA